MVVEDGKQNNLINAENWLLSDNGKDKKAVRQYLQAIPAERLAPVMAGAVIRMSAFRILRRWRGAADRRLCYEALLQRTAADAGKC